MNTSHVKGITVEPGHVVALPLVLAEPLSFWGGYDSKAGAVIASGHPNLGASLRDRVVLMAYAKGSSSSSSVLAEAIRNGTGPRALVMLEKDLIIALGAIIARELYDLEVPIVVVNQDDWSCLARVTTPIIVDAGEAGIAELRWSSQTESGDGK